MACATTVSISSIYIVSWHARSQQVYVRSFCSGSQYTSRPWSFYYPSAVAPGFFKSISPVVLAQIAALSHYSSQSSHKLLPIYYEITGPSLTDVSPITLDLACRVSGLRAHLRSYTSLSGAADDWQIIAPLELAGFPPSLLLGLRSGPMACTLDIRMTRSECYHINGAIVRGAMYRTSLTNDWQLYFSMVRWATLSRWMGVVVLLYYAHDYLVAFIPLWSPLDRSLETCKDTKAGDLTGGRVGVGRMTSFIDSLHVSCRPCESV